MLTFFTLQSHSGLQVVHLQLKAFQCAVCVSGLPLVSDEHSDDDQQKETTTSPDTNDGRKCEEAVGVDVQSPGGVDEASCSNLNTHRNGQVFLNYEETQCPGVTTQSSTMILNLGSSNKYIFVCFFAQLWG